MVVAQDSAEALTTGDLADQTPDFGTGIDDLVSERLMRPLGVVMPDEFTDGVPQLRLSEEDHPVEQLVAQRADEAPGDRVAV